ncbi:MAG: type II secretion system protein GspF [Deltaproteobacteria bacterium CG2_30_63_29]|nr:MAG: type II secretion system protein GspF [Deltaproteobacteria bacterium CG2_30_63_29]PJB40585.1 MAG: type II secretion system protein GspF [Deltaproteobacteria bacterium CG_4_9_14_3_um_filter_63_12]
MPLYEYKGMSAAGKAIKGLKEATSEVKLRDGLQRTGVFLTEVHEKGQNAKKSEATGLSREVNISFSFVTKRDVALLTRQFATLQRAAIPLVESLAALTDQADKPQLKSVLADVKSKVNEGSSLAAAMADHPKVFDDLFINMIRAGESSGNLDIVLERLADFTDGQVRMRSKVTTAMFYPIIMVVVGMLLMLILFTFVIPRVTKLFEQQRKPLPFITEVLMGTAHFMASYWWLVILGGAFVVFLFRKWTSSETGRKRWDIIKLNSPLFGEMIRMIAIARFARTMSTLLASGVPLLKAMSIVKNILGNTRLIEVVEKASDNIREGESIAGPLRRSNEFPPIVTHMIAVGERAGKLEEMLNSVAVSYEEQVEVRVEMLTTLLEPMMILIMGGAVGFVVFAILLPILQLNDGFG